MHVRYSLLASQAATALFVLLWGSAAIFTRWGLDNASPMALIIASPRSAHRLPLQTG